MGVLRSFSVFEKPRFGQGIGPAEALIDQVQGFLGGLIGKGQGKFNL